MGKTAVLREIAKRAINEEKTVHVYAPTMDDLENLVGGLCPAQLRTVYALTKDDLKNLTKGLKAAQAYTKMPSSMKDAKSADCVVIDEPDFISGMSSNIYKIYGEKCQFYITGTRKWPDGFFSQQ